MNTETRFVAYYRVSTEGQGKSGLGLEAQKQAVQDYVPDLNNIISQFVEIESGKKNDRPELNAALECAKQEGATLLIAKLDRLARNVAFIANLLDSGVDVVAVDMPAANKFMLHVMAAVAEQEALAISQRTKAALKAAKERGVLLGWSNPKKRREQKTPSALGAATNKSKADQFAMKMYPCFLQLELEGKTNPSDMARALNDRGFKTIRGRKWYPSSARNLILRIKGLLKTDSNSRLKDDVVWVSWDVHK